MSLIKVDTTYACPKCSTINIRREEEMDQEQFDKLSVSHPDEYWKEDKSGTDVYRHHEESNEGKCRRSC